jgi:hypothetical protein
MEMLLCNTFANPILSELHRNPLRPRKMQVAINDERDMTRLAITTNLIYQVDNIMRT